MHEWVHENVIHELLIELNSAICLRVHEQETRRQRGQSHNQYVNDFDQIARDNPVDPEDDRQAQAQLHVNRPKIGLESA